MKNLKDFFEELTAPVLCCKIELSQWDETTCQITDHTFLLQVGYSEHELVQFVELLSLFNVHNFGEVSGIAWFYDERSYVVIIADEYYMPEWDYRRVISIDLDLYRNAVDQKPMHNKIVRDIKIQRS